MPELPEVETTRRGIAPHILGQRVQAVQVRDPRLRWPVPADLQEQLVGQQVEAVDRRGKYILVRFQSGHLLVHLGMSGRLRVLPGPGVPPDRHDHYDIVFVSGATLRYTDPRRFGTCLWLAGEPGAHWLLRGLGPEPLDAGFDGAHLHRSGAGRRVAVKNLLMNAQVVVGVGNIYANEALYRAGIDPRRAAGRIARARYDRLADAVKAVLAEAIEQGGTTLRDYYRGDGSPGFFALHLGVYGRQGERCRVCGDAVRQVVVGQRSTYYCPSCQR